MDYLIERFDISQISQLKLLFQAVYNKNSLDLDGLEDRFKTAKFGGECIGYFAYSPDENLDTRIPAAYYGVFPAIATLGGKRIMCAQSGDSMTHPNHRNKGLFTELAKKTYETAKQEGIEFIFGFPGPIPYQIFKHKLKWELPYNMVKFTRVVPALPTGIIKKKLNMKIGPFNDSVLRHVGTNNLCPSTLSDQWYINNDEELEILRDNNYWEYKKSLPDNKLFIDLQGVCALLKFDGSLSIGNIIGDTSGDSLKKLFETIDNIAVLSGAPQIKTFLHPGSDLLKPLANFGKLSEGMPYGYINLTNRYDPGKLALDYVDLDFF